MIFITDYEKSIRHRMIDVGMNQNELIHKVNEKGIFVDGGYLWKILKGKRNAPKVRAAIEEVISEAEKERS